MKPIVTSLVKMVNAIKETKLNTLTLFLLLLLLILPLASSSPSATKVKDFGPKLAEFIEKNPEKNWLIEFYAPWCYMCQQIETMYSNVAEKIYHQHDNLIVGRVDCTEHMTTCERYDVDGYPTIIFMNTTTQIKYYGPRNEAELFDFAERLNGPMVRRINDCSHLKDVASRHEHIVLSTDQDLNSSSYKDFQSLAGILRPHWWFYHLGKSCKNFVKENELYVLRKDLKRAIQFSKPEPTTTTTTSLKSAKGHWLNREAFPIYGELNTINYDRAMSSGKMLIIAILDEYKPAKKFTQASREFHKSFGELARKISQQDEDLLFLWTSDVDLIESIALRRLPLPNVMILKSDHSYRLILPEQPPATSAKKNIISEKLSERSIKMHIAASKLDDSEFEGGNTPLYLFSRYVYSQMSKFFKVYYSDPLLVTILIVFPLIMVMFVIYQTCNETYEGEELVEEEEDDKEEEELINDNQERDALLSNHDKQD